MKNIHYKTSGTCCREINLVVDDNNIIQSAEFIGGCAGNLVGIKQLVEGQNANEVAERLANVKCGDKSTSCPDQLSKAIKANL